ncbi:MAG: LapA family protein [Syntrophaceae bacterium]|nr:LapA family protein [Syntrophaceae bacterium]
MKWVRTFFWTVAFFVAVLFAIQNRNDVILRFIFPIENIRWFEIPPTPLPLFLVVFCSIFLGVCIGVGGDLLKHFRLKKTIRQHQKTIERLEREIQSIRIPGLDQPSFLKEEH